MQKKNPLGVLIDTASDVAQFSTRGLRNNNPGNIRISGNSWFGKVPVAQNTDGAFEQFTTPEAGLRALDKLLSNYRKQGNTTIATMISKYAPGNENDTGAYIASVEKNTGVGRNSIYPDDHASRIRLVRAIVKHENGIDPYTNALIERAIA